MRRLFILVLFFCSPTLAQTTLLYGSYFGPTSNDSSNQQAVSVAVDGSGNYIIYGITNSVNFPHTLGSGKVGAQNCTLASMTNTGTLNWSRVFGSMSTDTCTAMVIGSDGNIYTTGFTIGTNFPTTSGVVQTTRSGSGNNCFISTFDTSGNFLASTYLGTAATSCYDIKVAATSHNVYVAGSKSTSAAATCALASNCNAYIAETNSALTTLVFSDSSIGSSTGKTVARAVGVNSGETAVYLAGDTLGTAAGDAYNVGTFPVTSGVLQSTCGNPCNTAQNTQVFGQGWIGEYASGTFTALTYLGGHTYLINGGATANGTGSYTVFNGMAIDSSGHPYVAGFSNNTDFPMAGTPFQSTYAGTGGTNSNATATCDQKPGFNTGGTGVPSVSNVPCGDSVFVEMSTDLKTELASTYYGGAGNDAAWNIAIDGSGRIWASGHTQSSFLPTLPVSSNAFQAKPGGGLNMWVAGFGSNLSTLFYGSVFGGTADQSGYGIAFDGSGNPVFDGISTSASTPTTANAYEPVNPSSAPHIWQFVASIKVFGSQAPQIGVAKGEMFALSKTGLLYGSYFGPPDADGDGR